MKYAISALALFLLVGAGCAPSGPSTARPKPLMNTIPFQELPGRFMPETELVADAPERTDTWVAPVLLTFDSPEGSAPMGEYSVTVKLEPVASDPDAADVHFYLGENELTDHPDFPIPALRLRSFASENADWFFVKLYLMDDQRLFAEASGGHEAYPRFYRLTMTSYGEWQEFDPWEEAIKAVHPDTIEPAFTLDVGLQYLRFTEQSGGGYGDMMHTPSPGRDALAQVYLLDKSSLAIVDRGTVMRQADRGTFEEPAYGFEAIFIRGLRAVEFGYEIDLEMGTFFSDDMNAAKAVREDGLCTADEYRATGCSAQRPNGFYLRRNQGNTTEFVAEDVPVVLQEVYQPEGAPTRVLIKDFLAMFEADPSWADRPFSAMYQEQFLTKLTEIYIP